LSEQQPIEWIAVTQLDFGYRGCVPDSDVQNAKAGGTNALLDFTQRP
jgi:hypothetical protein